MPPTIIDVSDPKQQEPPDSSPSLRQFQQAIKNFFAEYQPEHSNYTQVEDPIGTVLTAIEQNRSQLLSFLNQDTKKKPLSHASMKSYLFLLQTHIIAYCNLTGTDFSYFCQNELQDLKRVAQKKASQDRAGGKNLLP